jgi:hypothetical protein
MQKILTITRYVCVVVYFIVTVLAFILDSPTSGMGWAMATMFAFSFMTEQMKNEKARLS